jgi:alkylation response protein AidB-like acyl-CoA dehydrogenase
MSAMRTELEDSARKVFPDWEAVRDGDAAWAQVAELGWFMAGVPEDMGGLGLERADLAVIFTQLGRALVPGAMLAQFLSVEALVGSDPFDGRDDMLESAMAGELLTASLAIGADGALAVPDADKAGHMLLRGADEVALVSLDGASLEAFETWDKTRRLFTVRPASGAARIVLATGDRAAALTARIDALLALALAGDALGGAGAVLTMAVDYLGTRRQFDRPLAMFQALKHRAADLKAAIETATALYDARCDAGLPATGAMKAHCAEVYKQVAEEAVQFHGGIGLTVEYPVHLFLKRAFLNRELGGNAAYWNEKAGRSLLAEPA